MNVKLRAVSLIRSIGGAPVVDYLHYVFMRVMKRKKNRAFRAENPNINLPPAYLVYESFQMDYAKYYHGGKETAKWIIGSFRPYLKTDKPYILDWGCGPARVVRHLPELLGSHNTYHGCDYNPKTIAWCKANIPGITFSLNGLNPPLPYESNFFDALYGISIFTHLSEQNHPLWITELNRALRKEGVLLLTTHGEAFKEKLTAGERSVFDSGQLVIRDKAKEGQRMYGAFHPPSYLTRLFQSHGFEIVKHVPGTKRETYIEQDTWVLRKVGE